MGDSTDDDRPLGQRKIVDTSFLRSDSDDGSPIPEWISQNTPQKPPTRLDDSDDDDLIDLATQADTETGGDGKTDAEKKIETKTAASSKPSPALKAIAGPKKAEVKSTALKSKLPPAAGSQASAKVSAMPDAASGAEIPLVLPEKFQGLRYLVELEADSEGGDLAGDAGAVGRFTSAGKAGKDQEMLLDLKGRIYSTSLVSCATTFCVVNLQPSEARVEALLENFVSLREDERHAQGNANKDFFMYDDDEADAYQVGNDEKASQNPGKRKAATEAEDAPKAKRKAVPKPANVKKKAVTKAKGVSKAGNKAKLKKK